MLGGFEGERGEKLAGGGIGEFGGGYRAVGIELHADSDAYGAVDGGARFFGDFRKDFANDGERGRIGFRGGGRLCRE